MLETEHKISEFKLDLFKNTNIELHFNKESLKTKKHFFKLWAKGDFEVFYFKTDNSLSFSAQISNALLEHKNVTKNSIIFIDGFRTRRYNRKIISEIKKSLRGYGLKIKSIKYIDSKNSNLIQLADMCAGCIRRKLERNTKEDDELFALIKHLIV
jgi:hypothetical protein